MTATISVRSVNERGRLEPTETLVVRICRDNSASRRDRNAPRPRIAEYRWAVNGFKTRLTKTRPWTAKAIEIATFGLPLMKLSCPAQISALSHACHVPSSGLSSHVGLSSMLFVLSLILVQFLLINLGN